MEEKKKERRRTHGKKDRPKIEQDLVHTKRTEKIGMDIHNIIWKPSIKPSVLV